MTELVVTGGAGFIGANFVHYWRRHYPDDAIVVVDSLSHGSNRANLPRDITFVQLDIRLLRHLSPIAIIVHFAAESHVDRSIEASAPFIQSNIVGTHALLEAALEHNCRFHHVSTDEVYGSLGPNDAPFTEQTRYDPKSPYAASKAASDHLVRAYAHTYGLPVTITNCCNNYGPFQHTEKLIPLTIANALQGKPLPVYGDGSNIREWIYVEDHCRAIDVVLKHGVIGETYNVGTGTEISNLELVKLICDLLPCPRGLIEFVKDRPGHDWRYATNWTKLAKLGFVPSMPFKDGLIQTIDWYRRHYGQSA